MTIAVTLQNGVGNAQLLAGAFGPDRVVHGTAHVPADLAPPNIVMSHGFAKLHVGGFVHKAHDSARCVAGLLKAARFDCEVSEDIESEIWTKLAFNAGLNAMAMVSRSENGAMACEAALWIAERIVEEAAQVFSAKGGKLDAEAIKRRIVQAVQHNPRHKASMLQDREHGRFTEIESINSAILREGERLGIDTPVTATLANLVRLIEGNSPKLLPEGL